MLKMQKNIRIFEANSHKSYEILQRIYFKYHMTSHEYYINTKGKLRYIEISARKLHLRTVISGLKIKLFLNKSIGFHYPFENFNDYLPFKCLMVGGKSPVGAYKRVEALQFFHVFKTILTVSLRRDEMLNWLIFHLFGNLSDNNWRQFY